MLCGFCVNLTIQELHLLQNLFPSHRYFFFVCFTLAIYYYFYCCAITAVPMSPSNSPPPHPLSPLTFNLSLHVVFVHESFICVSWWPFPFLPPLFSPLPSGDCQFVLYFYVSGSLLLTFLFCWLGSTYRWDHMVFVPHLPVYFILHNALQFHPCITKCRSFIFLSDA